MARSRWRPGILAMASAILGLSATALWAGDGERSQKADEPAMFRNAVLNRYDDNHNGRLDSKEKAVALRELTGRNTSDDDVNALRSQILARFDRNHNGKLERVEVRTALSTVNVKRKHPRTIRPLRVLPRRHRPAAVALPPPSRTTRPPPWPLPLNN